MSKLLVLDYGMGNLRSVAKAFEHVSNGKTQVSISSDAQAVREADRLVLPGQGALPDCMKYLNASGLREALNDFVKRGRPLFGVCVGEQMLFEQGDEGGHTECLGLLKGEVKRFPKPYHLKVPHMGWNRVSQSAHPVWEGIADNSYFYFVHSFYAVPRDENLSIGVCDYGQRFTCAVASANIVATQFHPEKSARDGLKLYENFLSWHP